MQTLVYYTGNMGFCSNMISIIRAIEYCSQNNLKMKICSDYSMHGDFSRWFDFGIEFVHMPAPGYLIPDTPEQTVVHPHWDNPNPSLATFEKITNVKSTQERLREIAHSIKPKIDIPWLKCSTYDAVHIRRGDALTSGEGGTYHHGSEYLKKTTCDDVFVMSDDYRVLGELSGVTLHHMIPEYEVGNWSTPNYVTAHGQPVFLFQSTARKNEINDRLVRELYIASNSETFVSTNSSVGDFVRLIHKNPEKCINLSVSQ